MELLNSQRLAAHFEEHPGDLALLKHDRPLAKAAAPAHLRVLPAYLRAAAGPVSASSVGNTGRGARKLGARLCYCAPARAPAVLTSACGWPRQRLVHCQRCAPCVQARAD